MLVAAVVGAVSLVGAAPASAAFGIAEFTGEVRANQAGDPATQAGAHPFDATTTFKLNTVPATLPFLGEVPEGQIKDVEVDLPPGFVVDPSATPTCPEELLSSPDFENGTVALCPGSTQIGVAVVQTDSTGFGDKRLVPVFNIAPVANEPARVAFNVVGTVVSLSGSVRTGNDYGLTASVRNVSQTLLIRESTVTLWGVPADPAHDAQRGDVCGSFGPLPTTCSVDAGEIVPGGAGDGSGVLPAGVLRRPLVTTPMDCSAGPLTTTMRMSSWANPDVFVTASFDHDVNGVPMEVEGCEQVPFDPSITVQPTSRQPDAPTGLEVELRVPQSTNPDGLATSHLKKAVVTLPEGMSVSPASAHGLEACAPAQIGLANADEPSCPDASRIGTIEVDTPLLEDEMTGEVYVAKQGDNPFGSLLAIYLVARAPGVLVKLAGRVDTDPVTGRLTTTVDNNPQLPFSSFRLRFKGGPTAPLANPPSCGVKTVEAELSPWSGNPPSEVTDSFTIDCPGAETFAPSFAAGATSPVGGAFSPFVARIARPDRQQVIDGVSMELPPGLVAKLRGVALCPDSRAGDGTPGACPVESRIGSVTTGAGPGAAPFHIQGSVYLTGPYKGGPYGLSVQVHAKAGPFDLGMVKVRQAIHVDPVDAHLRVVSDPLPTILEGIPLRLRTIDVDVDRPSFTVNPTSCDEKQIKASFHSLSGAVANALSRFQVGDCRALPLRPRMRMALLSRSQRYRFGHPALRAVVTQTPGQANLERVKVKLPRAVVLDAERAADPQLLCSYEGGLKSDCPASSIIGRAVAHTPLLERPLSGPVHFVQGIRFSETGNRIRTFPTLLIKLRGEVAIDVRAKSSVSGGRLVTTFPAVPDAPISKFTMRLVSGKRGILVVTENLCRADRLDAAVQTDGQNGRRADFTVGMRRPCGRAARPAKSPQRRGAQRR
jgi:hypothetical protein